MTVQDEVTAVEAAHRAAQARLGIAAAYLSLTSWQTVSAANAGATSATWLTQSLRIIYAVRLKSSRLAQAYYQLVRALETGRTLGQPANAGEGEVTLAGLRQQFTDLMLEVTTIDTEPGVSGDPDEEWFESELRRAEVNGADANARSVRLTDTNLDQYIQDLLDATGSDDRRIAVDNFTWPPGMTIDQVERAFADLLQRDAIDGLMAKVKKMTAAGDMDADAAFKALSKEYDASGSNGAGLVDWAGMTAGREDISTAIRSDRRVRVVARGVGPNPCAWCAMLASRGFVYLSNNSAGFGADGISRWHKNCHCYPIVRFRDASALPERNAYYKAQWEIVTKGLSGQAARIEWRRWIEGRQDGSRRKKKTLTPST